MPLLTEQKLRLAIREEIEASKEYRNLSPRQKQLLEEGVLSKIAGAVKGAATAAAGAVKGAATAAAGAARKLVGPNEQQAAALAAMNQYLKSINFILQQIIATNKSRNPVSTLYTNIQKNLTDDYKITEIPGIKEYIGNPDYINGFTRLITQLDMEVNAAKANKKISYKAFDITKGTLDEGKREVIENFIKAARKYKAILDAAMEKVDNFNASVDKPIIPAIQALGDPNLIPVKLTAEVLENQNVSQIATAYQEKVQAFKQTVGAK